MCEYNAVISGNIIGAWECMTHQSHHDFASAKSKGNKAKRTSIFRRHMMIMMRDIFIYFLLIPSTFKGAAVSNKYCVARETNVLLMLELNELLGNT